MPVRIGDVTEAFEIANTTGYLGEFRAFVGRRTGKIHYDFADAAEVDDELPDDIDDEALTAFEIVNMPQPASATTCICWRNAAVRFDLPQA
jgi:hypothetical protein